MQERSSKLFAKQIVNSPRSSVCELEWRAGEVQLPECFQQRLTQEDDTDND